MVKGKHSGGYTHSGGYILWRVNAVGVTHSEKYTIESTYDKDYTHSYSRWYTGWSVYMVKGTDIMEDTHTEEGIYGREYTHGEGYTR